MKKLNKKSNVINNTLEAFYYGCSCYCRCGCEHTSGSESIGIHYFSMDSNSTSDSVGLNYIYKITN